MNYSELRRQSRENLKGNWGTLVLAFFIMTLIEGTAETLFMFSDSWYFLGTLATLLLTGPLTYGFSRMVLNVSRNQKVETGDLFVGFNNYSKTVMLGIDIMARVILWSLLLIIPGIIAAYSYSMSYYILIDNPNLTSSEAINKSKELMKGHKLELFLLELTFIGWALLAVVFTFGIGLLWVQTYMEMAKAEFYKKLTGVYESPFANKVEEVGNEQKVVSEGEIKPYKDNGDASIIYNLKCPKCGAKETHTEDSMICPYCDAEMKEDR